MGSPLAYYQLSGGDIEYDGREKHQEMPQYREGNKLADELANLALDKGDILATTFHDLESEWRRIVNSDKLNLPCLRIRKYNRI